jgi:L-rhamnose isomerase/sugar isomerase
MIDQSHNLKNKLEATIQTVVMAQQLRSKAALVNHEKLALAQKRLDLVAAESILQDAFSVDVRPAIEEWRQSKGLPRDPLKAYRECGYLQRITAERSSRNSRSVSSYA